MPAKLNLIDAPTATSRTSASERGTRSATEKERQFKLIAAIRDTTIAQLSEEGSARDSP